MTESVHGNVLQFDSRRYSSDTTRAVNRLPLLNSCRDSLLSGVAAAFDEGLGNSQDHLFEMADRASSLDMQNLYFAAHNTLRKRGQELLEEFQARFTRNFNEAVSPSDKSSPAPALAEADELRLIDEQDFERELAISKLSARAAYNCAHQLTALDRRMSELLGGRPLSHDDNPLAPKAVFSAFLRTILDLEIGDQIAVALLQELDRQIADRLPSLYQAVNRLLKEHGVLPDLPQGPGGVSRSGPAPEAPPPSAAAAPAAGYAESPVLPPGGAEITQPPASPADFFAQLARSVQAFQPAGAESGFALANPPGGVLEPASLQADAPLAAQLLTALTSLQRGRYSPPAAPGTYPVPVPPRSASQGVLRQIRATPIAKLAGPVDGVTIDIVATLFDLIFSDHQLPDPLRAQVARLQIPALKVALIDKTFFSNKRHPARRLLDAIAGSTTGRGEDEMPALLAEVEAIVDTVVEGFESDIGIFSDQHERLEAFLDEERSEVESQHVRLVEGLERRERIERARSMVSDQIDRRIKGRNVPALVCDFLSKLWRLFLIRVFVDKGKESAAWRAAMQTMDDLVWSVLPKHDSKERRRMLTLLPDLLQRLRSGLEGLVIAKADREEFFRELVKLHMAAMRADLPQSGPEEETEASTGLFLSTPVQDAADAKGEAPAIAPPPEPEAPKPVPEQPAAEAEGDKYLQAARELDLGAWVEFTSDRGIRRTLRLTWVSGFRTIYLFAGRQGDDPLSLPTARLAQRLRDGSARILTGDRLTERAVNQLLDATKKKLGGAEGSAQTTEDREQRTEDRE